MRDWVSPPSLTDYNVVSHLHSSCISGVIEVMLIELDSRNVIEMTAVY